MTKLYNMYFNTKCNLKNSLKDEKGQGLVEYVLIIAVIAIGVIGAMSLLSTQIGLTFGKVTTEITK
jgi:pilus assembly protein Flp/PilA